MKILTGFAIINDTAGKRVSYTFSEVDSTGKFIRQNVKENFIILDEETNDLVLQVERKIKERL